MSTPRKSAPTSPAFETVSAIQAYRQPCQDCVAVFTDDTRTVIAVADGAGGSGSGELAAKAAVREIESAYGYMHAAIEWAALLGEIDRRITDGETTLVVVDVRTFGIAGASVGDSRAMVIADGQMIELTANQKRKPLLGSGQAEPVAFIAEPLSGLILVGTDGFFNYAKPEQILRLVSTNPFETIPRKCVDLVRLPSGEYWDDIGIIALRRKPYVPARRRYSLD